MTAWADSGVYMPDRWADDLPRRRAAGIPDDLKFTTKPQLAIAQVRRLRAAGLPVGWAAADEAYGRPGEPRKACEEAGLAYVLIIPCVHPGRRLLAQPTRGLVANLPPDRHRRTMLRESRRHRLRNPDRRRPAQHPSQALGMGTPGGRSGGAWRGGPGAAVAWRSGRWMRLAAKEGYLMPRSASGSCLEEPSVVDDQHTITVTEVGDHIVPHVVADTVDIPVRPP